MRTGRGEQAKSTGVRQDIANTSQPKKKSERNQNSDKISTTISYTMGSLHKLLPLVTIPVFGSINKFTLPNKFTTKILSLCK